MHVYAAVLAVMDLVVPDDRTAVCPDLDSCQGVTVDVIPFNEAPAITKDINTTLVAIKNGIAPYCGIAVRGDPHPCKVICIDLVFNELASALFVYIDAPCLTMMDLTTNHCRIGVCFDLKASYTVPMDIAALKVTHAVVKGKNSHISSVVDVIPPDDRVPVVLHPDPGQSIVGDLIIFVYSLCMVCDIKANVFTVTDVAVLDSGTSTLATDTDSRPHCTCAAYYAVVDDGAAVDCDLQAVMGIVVLGGFIIRIKPNSHVSNVGIF